MRPVLSLLLVLSVVTLFGCGGEVETPETTEDSVTLTIRPILEKLAEDGDLEAAGELQSHLEEDLADVDEAKSQALLADWDEIQGMSSPDEIKAKAQEMIGKL